MNLPQLASRNQIKPYRVHCLSERRGEFWVYLGDRGQFNRRQRRRVKKAARHAS